MNKFLSFAFVFIFSMTLLKPSVSRAEMPVKAKAFMTMATYGAAGGAILGFATMAFGNSSRAIAQGASLGLYAGIIFGSYVLISHYQKQAGTYDDNSSPYQESTDIYGDGYDAGEGGGTDDGGSSGKGGFFDRFEVIQEHVHNQSFTFQSQKRRNTMPPVHMNLFQYNF
jgi:hypothetical protein